MIFAFPQSFYIQQLLTIDHDCPVPVEKHGNAKIDPTLVKYLNFAITEAAVNIFFAEICMQAEGQ